MSKMSESLNTQEEKIKELEQLPFEAAIQRLEEVVSQLEKGDVPLEKSIELFQEGMLLSRVCGKKLEDVGQKIEMLIKENEKWLTKPFLEEDN